VTTTPSAPAPATEAGRGGEGTPPATQVGADSSATPSRWLLFAVLAIGIVVVDQIVKAWIVANFDVGAATQILGDYVRIWLSHNTGALFGMFRDQAPIFALFSLAVIGIILWFEGHAGGNLIVTIALGCLLGGALGNLTDRLRLGYVNDFVDLGIGTWRWYTFNVADAAISLSIVLLIALAIFPALSGMGSGGPKNEAGRDG
jgi:signal peptidase II